MRTITKLREPDSLARHRNKPGAVFDLRATAESTEAEATTAARADAETPIEVELPNDAKQELRENLVEEQRGLCCYCCCRIEATWNGMKIEHWKPIKKHKEHQLDYWNLLGACNGGEGRPSYEQHCDTFKKNKDLSKNPAEPLHRIDDIVHYLTDATIRSTDAILDSELGEDPLRLRQNSGRVLNLNLPHLRNNRKAALDAFKQGLDKRGSLQRPTVERLLSRWRGDAGGMLEPYSPIVVWWLKKRLKQL